MRETLLYRNSIHLAPLSWTINIFRFVLIFCFRIDESSKIVSKFSRYPCFTPRRECEIFRLTKVNRLLTESVLKPILVFLLFRQISAQVRPLQHYFRAEKYRDLHGPRVSSRRNRILLSEEEENVWKKVEGIASSGVKFTNTRIVLFGAKIERFSAVSFPLVAYVRSPSFDLRISRWRTAQHGASLFLLCNRRQAVRCSRPNCRCVSTPVKYT